VTQTQTFEQRNASKQDAIDASRQKHNQQLHAFDSFEELMIARIQDLTRGEAHNTATHERFEHGGLKRHGHLFDVRRMQQRDGDRRMHEAL